MKNNEDLLNKINYEKEFDSSQEADFRIIMNSTIIGKFVKKIDLDLKSVSNYLLIKTKDDNIIKFSFIYELNNKIIIAQFYDNLKIEFREHIKIRYLNDDGFFTSIDFDNLNRAKNLEENILYLKIYNFIKKEILHEIKFNSNEKLKYLIKGE